VSAGVDEHKGAPLVAHLAELRRRLLWSVLAVVIMLVPLALFAREYYTLLAGPLLQHLPEGSSMIATEVASPFLAPFKLAAVSALILAMPVVLWHVWAFVAPGLYQQERRFVMPLMAMSTALFYLGVAFAYFVVLPLVLGFFVAMAPQDVAVMTDIARYLDFVLTLFLAFGAAFQIPVATILMVRAGLTTPAALASKRAYVLVGAFVLGMLLTPPDVFSQSLLAVPAYLLYEAGIVLARWLVPGSREVEIQRGERPPD